MEKYLISVIAISFFIISCSHGITRDFPTGEKITDPTEIIIIRNWNFFCGGQSTKILLDGVSIAYLRMGDYVSVPVEPGWHSFEAVPVIGEPGYISGHFEKGKKHYLLISLIFFKESCDVTAFDIIFYALGAYSAVFPCESMHICEFEIENIGEERGLKRVKRSKNLTKRLKVHESVSEAPRTAAGSKKRASSINPAEPWTGVWSLKYYYSGGLTLGLRQNRNMVKSTEDSCCKLEGIVVNGYLEGWMEIQKRRHLRLKMSPDNLSFNGDFRSSIYGVYSQIWGKREE